QTLITSEGLNLWAFKGCHPHEGLLQLRVDSGGFPPLAAYQYLKKEQAAWEAHYGKLTEEFLQEQNPDKAGEGKSNHNMDFTYAIEASDKEEFLAELRGHQPRALAMGFNGISAFAKYHYKDTSALPEGVFALLRNLRSQPSIFLRESCLGFRDVSPGIQCNL
ncbi:hypothetical protein FRC11_002059, partial [Ceratobasidium sp. 423]